MIEPMDRQKREDLMDLYAELHLVCGRAAALLRLAGKQDAPEDDLLRRFQEYDALAASIWDRITALRNDDAE